MKECFRAKREVRLFLLTRKTIQVSSVFIKIITKKNKKVIKIHQEYSINFVLHTFMSGQQGQKTGSGVLNRTMHCY